MKFQFKALAAAVALIGAASAHADLVGANTGNSSFAFVAFDTVTGSYYVRDLGYTLNSFLPSSVTTTATDGGGTPVTGTMTPDAGKTVSWAADTTFTSWLAGETLSNVVWTVAAGDSLFTANSTSNVSREIVAQSTAASLTVTNLTVRNGVASSAGVSGLATQNNPLAANGSATGSTVLTSFLTNNSVGAETLTSFGGTANLFYYTTTNGSGASSTAANVVEFGNSKYFATLSVASNGDLTYNLQAAAVPVPGSVWLMGAGLLAVGGMIRRRRADAAL